MDISDRLSEEEVERVLERATQREGPERGMTIGELHEIAHEVGIPEEALSEALREVKRTAEVQDRSTSTWASQSRTSIVATTVDDPNLAWLLRFLARTGQLKGGVDYEDGLVRWRSSEGYQVEVVPRPSETKITVSAHDRGHLVRAAGGFMLAGAAWGIALSPLFGDLSPALVEPMIWGAAAGAASWVVYWRGRVTAAREGVRKLAGGLADALGMVASRPSED